MLGVHRKKRKRRLTEAELVELRAIMEAAPANKKPSLRFFARYFGCNQPSIAKSLGGWKGIERGRPVPFKPEIIKVNEKIKLEEYTTEVEVKDAKNT